jgi:hypothetical protein
MSGGSLNYVFSQVDDAAHEIRRNAETPLHHAFADHLVKVSKALHDIEWLFSGDYGDGREVEAIREVVSPEAELQSLVARAEAISVDLQRLIVEARHA